MAEQRSVERGLLAGGILTSGMAIYHFWLPFQFGWPEDLARAPMLGWGLLMINASFSFLLLAFGLISLAIALRIVPREGAGTWVIGAVAAYWVFNAAYQLVAPMPMPARLASLKWALAAFALVVAFLYSRALRPPRARASGEPAFPTVDAAGRRP